MRLVTFTTNSEPRLGAQLNDHIIDLPGSYAAWLRTRRAADAEILNANTFPTSTLELLQGGQQAQVAVRQALTFAANGDNLAALARVGLACPAAEVAFLPPILRPGKIICLGLNYRSHIAEMGRTMAHPGRLKNIEEHGSDSPDTIHDKLIASYEGMVKTLEQMAGENLHIKGEHVKYGPQTLAEFIQHFMVEHDQAHVRQATELLATKDS